MWRLPASLTASVAASMASRAASSSLHPSSGRLRVALCVDFDETATRRDTIQLLFQLAGRSDARHAALVRQLVDRYASGMAAFLAAYPPLIPGYSRSFDAQTLDAFLAGYAATDMLSVQRVIASRALRGIETSELRAIGRTIALRDGCVEVLAAVLDVHVVSTNWSAEMVRAALDQVVPGKVAVCANELVVDDHGVSTGEIAVAVQSAADKAREVRRIRHSLGQVGDLAVVFVGDGVSDILAMLEADVGITLEAAKDSQESTDSLATLQGVVLRHGVAIEPLGRLRSLAACVEAARAAKAAASRVIFSAQSWTDIARVLPAKNDSGGSQ